VESGLRRERCRRVLGAWRSKDSWCRFLMGLEGDLSQGLGNEHAGVGPCTQRQAWNRTPPSAQTSRLVGRGGLLVARDVHAPCRVRVERRTVRWRAPSGIAILRTSCSRHRASANPDSDLGGNRREKKAAGDGPAPCDLGAVEPFFDV
jgi:hypothetical protein